jgi:hypothetical protein
MSRGKQALSRLLEQLAGAAQRIEKGESAEAIADAVWVDFRTAVAAAQAELREAEAAGVQQWQEARRGR